MPEWVAPGLSAAAGMLGAAGAAAGISRGAVPCAADHSGMRLAASIWPRLEVATGTGIKRSHDQEWSRNIKMSADALPAVCQRPDAHGLGRCLRAGGCRYSLRASANTDLLMTR